MKRILSVLMCFAMILSVMPMVSSSDEVAESVFVDFEDYVSGVSNGYKDELVIFPTKSYETPVIDEEHGKSIKLLSPLGSDTSVSEYMNLSYVLERNAVFGVSYMSADSSAGFVISSKATNISKNEKGWIDVNSILTIDGTIIKVGSSQKATYQTGEWLDILFAMDYTNHKVDVYLNGEYVATHNPNNENFKGTDRFNISIMRNKYSQEDTDQTKPAANIFDNMFVYYPGQEALATISGIPGDSESTDEIYIDFGQNVIWDDSASAVTLNGYDVDAKAVKEHGYVTGITIKNLCLSGDTQYTVSFGGITDYFGNEIPDCTFKTKAPVPSLSIACKNSDGSCEPGDIVNFEIESMFLGDNTIDIYLNGEIYETLDATAKEFYVALVGGDNEVYAEVPGLSLMSEKINIYVDTTPVIDIICENPDSSYKSGDSIKLKINSKNLADNVICIYLNGEAVKTLDADTKEFSVALVAGSNEIYAAVPAFGITTNSISIVTEAYGPVGLVNQFDFENGITDIDTINKALGILETRFSDDEHGNALYFELDGTGEIDITTANNRPYLIVEQFSGKKGIYVYEADMKFSQVEASGNIFPLKCKKSSESPWNMLYVLENGDIRLNVGNKETIYSGIKPDTWYNLKATWNSDTNTSEFYVDGVMVASDVPFSAKNIDSFTYVNMSLIPKAGEVAYMYMDNIKSYFIGKMSKATVDFDGAESMAVPYENAVINISFDQAMDADSLKNIRLTADTGNFTFADFESFDNRNFTANVSDLNPNTLYTIDISNAVAQTGVGVNPSKVSFKTQKAPFAIEDAVVSQSGSKLNVNVDIQNIKSEDKSFVVVATLYAKDKMLSYSVKSFASNKAETAKFMFDNPGNEYTVEIYMFDSLEGLNVLDYYIIL